MKIMTNVARGLLVVCSCLFMSGTTLNAARPERELEPYKIVDITEKLPVAAVVAEKAAEPVVLDKSAEKISSENAATAAPTKKKVSQPVKGVVYLPIVSLSSYVPIAAQILMMVLAIAISGLFGAWLMFRELAKRVQILQESLPEAVSRNQVAEFSQTDEQFTSEDFETPTEVIQVPVNPTPVKKRTLFVSRKIADDQSQEQLMQQVSYPVDNKLSYAPPKTKKRGNLENKPDDGKSNRMPKNFLINEWFPVER